MDLSARRHTDTFADKRSSATRHSNMPKSRSLKECSGCGRWKAAVKFAKNTRDASGLQPWCKSCHRRYNLEKPKVTTPTVREKRCSTCRRLKRTEEFNKDVSKPTGLRSQCNACRSDRRHAQRNHAKRRTQRSRNDETARGKQTQLEKGSAEAVAADRLKEVRTAFVDDSVLTCLHALPKSERLLAALLAVADYEQNARRSSLLL